MSTESQITNIVHDILKVEAMEEAFSCFLVHRPELEVEKSAQFQVDLQAALNGLVPEQQEAGVRQFLNMAAGMTNVSRLQMLLKLLEGVVQNSVVPPRLVCECILSCEKLTLTNQDFWVQCFLLMRRIIGGVDYKGVREIMKGCREKAAIIPSCLTAAQMPQLSALESVMEYIFDRNACLLPAYFIVNEIQKAYPENKNWPHWKLANLLSGFVESFRPCAQMVSIIGHSRMLPVVEHSGLPDSLSPWKLDPSSLKFTLKGILPFDKELLEPQTGLLRYVLEQPYSRDMVCCMLGLVKQHKQRCIALEDQLVALVVVAMERSEADPGESSHWLWLHLSSQLIYFVLFQFASFPNIVMALHEKLSGRELRKGRDHLMWVLLQFISGSIQRNPLSNFLPVLKLYDLLYPEKEPLPVPDVSKAICTHQMAMTCIWIHLLKKAQADHLNIQRPIPVALKVHHEYLQHLVQPSNNLGLGMGADYRIALSCNAYSTNQEFFTRPMAALVETILGAQKSSSLPPPEPTTPLSMAILDSLTVHSKMSLIHSIVTHAIKQAQSKSSLALAPALVETYSRLLVYTEIESLGIKGFIRGSLIRAVAMAEESEVSIIRFCHLMKKTRSLTAEVPVNFSVLRASLLILKREHTSVQEVFRLSNATSEEAIARLIDEEVALEAHYLEVVEEAESHLKSQATSSATDPAVSENPSASTEKSFLGVNEHQAASRDKNMSTAHLGVDKNLSTSKEKKSSTGNPGVHEHRGASREKKKENLIVSSNESHLPTILAHRYGGDYDEWLVFDDAFTAFVNRLPNLTGRESCLRGDAAQTVVSADDFEEAWNLLKTKYSNNGQAAAASTEKSTSGSMKINGSSSPIPLTRDPANLPISGSKTNLPTIQFPPFDGDYTKWPTFKDSLTAYVNRKSAMTGKKKLQLLKGCLRGDAMETVAFISDTNENFQKAWNLLKTRQAYDKQAAKVKPTLRPTNSLLDLFEKRCSSPTQSREIPTDETVFPTILSHGFDGDVAKREEFENAFTQFVRRQPNITGRDKLHILNCCLRGGAADIIGSILVTDDNFEKAWNLLKTRCLYKKDTSSRATRIGIGSLQGQTIDGTSLRNYGSTNLHMLTLLTHDQGDTSTLLPTVFKSHAWGILYTLLEMFSYRMHHIQPHYRVQLLSHLHSLAAVPQTNQSQLHLCVESTALRLITGLGSSEVQPQLSRFLSEPKTLVSAESEELNRALVLTLARSMHVTGTGSDQISGTWCKELLNTIMQNTPHSWANHTLQCFPPVLQEFFQQNAVPKENKPQLKRAVEEEFRNWSAMSNENDIINHFSVAQTPPLFICLMWKLILETDKISSIAYKILERTGARALSSHLRKFCDYLVFEFTMSRGEQHVNKCVDALNDMIWKYNIVTIDRLVLCLALRTQEGNEAQVCFFIIQLLLLKAAEFRTRVQDFVKENSPEHWKQSNWHEKHLTFHRKYPEKFAPEGILEQSGGASSPYHSLPVYFGNVCLRFLPVFDIVIHRYLELPPVAKSLETLLEHLGCLYKFHDRPVTYLYNTLHYYDRNLRDRPALRRRLVSAILGALKDIRPSGWSLSDQYIQYMSGNSDEVTWLPDLDYYIHLIRRIVETMNGSKTHFPPTDWRFNEFPNPAAHALHVTCVELMATPVSPCVVSNNLLDVVTVGYTMIPSNQIHLWINAVGLLLAALPESYWSVVDDRLLEILACPEMTNWSYHNSAFQLYNFNITHDSLLENKFSYTLALAHAMWHHAGVGQISTLPTFVKEKAKPIIKTEEQFLYMCHLVGPFLQRLNTERPRGMLGLTLELYELLEQVDKSVPHLQYMDPICDLLYHIKYMFVGDMMKNEVEGIIRRLRLALQMRLRFIAHLNIEEIHAT